jgi:transcriptional regulator with XRE-family HTH domain
MKLPFEKNQRMRVARAAGSAVADMRARAGMTQENVAEALGVGTDAVSRMERGVIELGVVRLVEFAELFGCGVAELLIPASERPGDQAAVIAAELADLSAKDRAGVVAMVRQLAEMLRGKPASGHAEQD